MSTEAPQPDQVYVVAALMEENAALNQHKLYLTALLRQLQAEYAEARAVWEIERGSLKAALHGAAPVEADTG